MLVEINPSGITPSLCRIGGSSLGEEEDSVRESFCYFVGTLFSAEVAQSNTQHRSWDCTPVAPSNTSLPIPRQLGGVKKVYSDGYDSMGASG